MPLLKAKALNMGGDLLRVIATDLRRRDLVFSCKGNALLDSKRERSLGIGCARKG
jgi:hypothetical protein